MCTSINSAQACIMGGGGCYIVFPILVKNRTTNYITWYYFCRLYIIVVTIVTELYYTQ